MRKKIKRPNGRGSVYKLSGNRHRPYAVAVTISCDKNDKPIQEIIDYACNEDEGIVILSNYFDDPYDLDYRNITFEYIWSKIFKKLEKLVMEGKMSQSNIDDYELPIRKNPADNLSAGGNIVSNKHIPFSKEEESILWGLQHNDLVKILIIMNWTGLRPSEIFTTKKTNIFIDLDYFVTGLKTEAGKDRPIPIHPKIKHLMQYFYNIDSEYPFQTIFDKYNYNKFSREYKKLMLSLGLDHTPHDGRHTFITNMKKAGANDYILKRIVGHSIKDITEKIYTHRDIQELIDEVRRLK